VQDCYESVIKLHLDPAFGSGSLAEAAGYASVLQGGVLKNFLHLDIYLFRTGVPLNGTPNWVFFSNSSPLPNR
jgi:hypothetical protein